MNIEKVIQKFVVLSFVLLVLFTIMPENAHASLNFGDLHEFFNGGHHNGGPSAVPEFALSAAAAAGAILAGGIAILFGRRKKHR